MLMSAPALSHLMVFDWALDGSDASSLYLGPSRPLLEPQMVLGMVVANSTGHFGSDCGHNSAYRCMDCIVGAYQPSAFDSTRCMGMDTGCD